jgi:hypothetical protein
MDLLEQLRSRPGVRVNQAGYLTDGPKAATVPGDPRFAGLPDELHYVDEPTSETTNDVCIRWNAPLVLVAARLLVQAA